MIARALEALDYAALEKKYDADLYTQQQIYPRGYTWKKEDGGKLLEKLKNLLFFVSEAGKMGLWLFRVFC